MTDLNKSGFDPGGYEVPPELWDELKPGKPFVVPLDYRPSSIYINGVLCRKNKDGTWTYGKSPFEDVPQHPRTYFEAAAKFRLKRRALFDLICNKLGIPALLDWLERLAVRIGIK